MLKRLAWAEVRFLSAAFVWNTFSVQDVDSLLGFFTFLCFIFSVENFYQGAKNLFIKKEQS